MEADLPRRIAGELGPGRTTALVAALLLLAVPWTAAVPAQAQAGSSGSDQAEPCSRDPLDVSLVLDRSGSMSGDKIDAAKEGARFLVGELGPADQSGLVSYDDDPRLDQSLTFDHEQTRDEIAQLQSGGSTATGDAIDVSHDDLEVNGRVGVDPIMIVLTDGKTNEGSDPVAQAQEAKDAGIEIFAIGIGSDVNEGDLKEIASDPTKDHYFNPENATELREVFRNLTVTIAGSLSAAESYGLRGKVVPGGEVPGQVTLHRTNQSLYPTGGETAVGSVDRSVAGIDVEASVLESVTSGNKTKASVETRGHTDLARVEVRAQGELLVEARGLRVTSESNATRDGAAWSRGGTHVSHLRVPGVGNFTGPFDPGTRIPLGDAGNLTVNETLRRTGPNGSSLRVNGLHLNLTHGNTSAELVLASAYSVASCGSGRFPVPDRAPETSGSTSAGPPALSGEDPPMTGFDEVHDPLGQAPDREVDREVDGVVEVSRDQSKSSGAGYSFQQDTVTVRVVPADTTVTVVYFHSESEYSGGGYQYDFAYAYACTPEGCTPSVYASIWDSSWEYGECEGGFSYLSAWAVVAGAFYYEYGDRCSEGDDSSSYRCRSAWSWAYIASAGAGRCSEEMTFNGERQRNENTYFASVYAPEVYVFLEQTNRHEERTFETEVVVSTPTGEIQRSVTLPPP